MAESPAPRASVTPATRAKSRLSGRKRSYVACQRCHSLKVKCSGSTPCQRCAKAQKGASCQYPSRDRRVTISESYLQQLQRPRQRADAEIGSGHDENSIIDVDVGINGDVADHIAKPTEKRSCHRTADEAESEPGGPDVMPSRPASSLDPRLSNVDVNVSNPIYEPGRIFTATHDLQQQFIGESTCSAFGDRILQCLDPQARTTPLPSDSQYVRHASFSRQLSSTTNCKLPDRIRANLLIRVAIRFIGQDYHLFMQRDFLHRLDKMYASAERSQQQEDSIWMCKFFAILALGQMYSTSLPSAKETGSAGVAGSEYFFTAVTLLQDLFEEPSLDQIETLLLFSFYSNALGRVRSAHMYSGMALRSSTALGLHRCVPESSTLSALDLEHRRRLWWTVYIIDRSTCSKLGQPIAIQDSDIDVAMPSTDALSEDELKSLGGSTDHLIAYINLARITGYIIKDIYVPSANSNGHAFVHSVRSILQKLRKWDHHVPARLRWDSGGGVPRSVASLQLHFNQCIILTTRPILLYVFKLRNPFAGNGDPPGSSGAETPTVSDTVKSLADSCVAAARTSNAIISQLFVENSLATCGYLDAHHLFASTLVLIVSAISSPNTSDSDAVQTAFQILMMMRDNGNVIAGEYFSRLLSIQWSVNRLFTRANTMQETTPDPTGGLNDESQGRHPVDMTSMDPMSAAVLDDYDWSKFMLPPNFSGTYDEEAIGVIGDPLDNPLLQAFLDSATGGQEGHQVSPEHIGYIL